MLDWLGDRQNHYCQKRNYYKIRVSLKPSFTTSREEFQNNRKFNPCWGKVAVRADLAITPCIMDKTLLAESGVPMAECLESEKLESFGELQR